VNLKGWGKKYGPSNHSTEHANGISRVLDLFFFFFIFCADDRFRQLCFSFSSTPPYGVG
jgi:hypothetical protein